MNNLSREQYVGHLYAVSRLQAEVREREGLVRPVGLGQEHVLGGAADIVPARLCDVCQQAAAIELAITEKDDFSLGGNKDDFSLGGNKDDFSLGGNEALDLSQQFLMTLLSELDDAPE